MGGLVLDEEVRPRRSRRSCSEDRSHREASTDAAGALRRWILERRRTDARSTQFERHLRDRSVAEAARRRSRLFPQRGRLRRDHVRGGTTWERGDRFFRCKKGRLSFFDRQKRKKAVPGTKDALLPAWSPDGHRVAYLQKDSRRVYRVMVMSVSRSSS